MTFQSVKKTRSCAKYKHGLTTQFSYRDVEILNSVIIQITAYSKMYQPKTESIFFLLEFAGCADYDNKLIRVVYQYQLTSMVKYLSVTVRNYAEK